MKNTRRNTQTLLLLLLLSASSANAARAQGQTNAAPAQTATAQTSAQPSAQPGADGIALAPARVELEMQPGSETTVVVNLDYRSLNDAAQSARIVASLNDWSITREGQVEFYRAGTQANSASPWLIYSPAETTVEPGKTHSIRVTVTVPKEAAPGDHLAALIVEQRPDQIKFNSQSRRQMIVRYRMACVFYIKVPQLTRRGSLENLQAAADSDGVTVVPTLKNGGNSVLRPVSSAKVVDASGRTVAELPEGESLPVLGGAELSQKLRIDKQLAPGAYSVKYRIDFQDGSRTTEGVTDLVVK
jgi:P pilus assembly chaperone PapD